MSETEASKSHEPEQAAIALPVQAAEALGQSIKVMKLPYRVALLALAVGLVGGSVGSYVYISDFASAIPAAKKQLVVQESSAYINIAKSVSPAVVSITSQSVTQGFFGEPETQSGAGTGMIIQSNGLILTNRHVVDDSTASYTVVLSSGKSYPAKVVSIDSTNDLAFVRISASGLPTVSLGDSSDVQVGQQVVAIGNALGQYQNTVTQGIISGLAREVTADDSQGSSGLGLPMDSTGTSENLQNLFQTDAAINPGNSGGPLLNLDGQVIGIDTAIAGSAQNIGFAIPINDVKPLVSSVESTGTISTAYLGVEYVELDPATAQANNLPSSNGAWIQGASGASGVIAGSPAQSGGLQNGDIITKVGSKSVDASNSLQALIEVYKPGQKAQLTVNRNGKVMTLTVTLGATPATQ